MIIKGKLSLKRGWCDLASCGARFYIRLCIKRNYLRHKHQYSPNWVDVMLYNVWHVSLKTRFPNFTVWEGDIPLGDLTLSRLWPTPERLLCNIYHLIPVIAGVVFLKGFIVSLVRSGKKKLPCDFVLFDWQFKIYFWDSSNTDIYLPLKLNAFQHRTEVRKASVQHLITKRSGSEQFQVRFFRASVAGTFETSCMDGLKEIFKQVKPMIHTFSASKRLARWPNAYPDEIESH